jgi:hypothetical protein
MALLDNLRGRFNNWFWSGMEGILHSERVKEMTLNREYYVGRQRVPLKTKPGQPGS